MKNIKTKSYMLWLFTLVTLWVTYAYSSVSNSLTYLRWAGDIGHIGYIITEIFWTTWTSSGKIKQEYLELPDSLTFVNSTGSTSTIQAPTINILTQVWDNLNTRINNLSWNISSIDLSTKVDKNANITAWTATKITYDAKWLVTTGTSLSATDIPVLDTWKITSGTFNIARIPTGTTSTTVSLWDHWHSGATTSVSGFMSSIDKTKLDGIATGANNYTHPSWDGNLHVPVTSTTNSGRVLTAWPTAGSLSWQTLPTSSTSVAWIVQLNNTLTSTATNQALTAAQWKVLEDNKAPLNSPPFTGTPRSTNPPNNGDESTQLATTARVKANTVSASSTITFSNCSTTDKKQMFYECDPTLSACSTVWAYCGWWKVAGIYWWSIIVSALSDEWKNTWGYANSYGNMNPATQMCWEKSSFGFDDWQLPNKEELNLLYTNKTTIWGFASGSYWSSTEYTSGGAWALDFSTGTQNIDGYKPNPYLVRCIRKY